MNIIGVSERYGIIEGVYFKVFDNSIFYSKGIVHPPWGVVGYPKYVPDERGSRVSPSGVRYVKYEGLHEQSKVLKERYNWTLRFDKCFGTVVPIIPLSSIREVYDPIIKLSSMRIEDPSSPVVELAEVLGEAAGWNNVGISGSRLVGLDVEGSDIDLVVYGVEEGSKAYAKLKEAFMEIEDFRGYREGELLKLYMARARETPLSLQEFSRQQSRRVLEGFFKDVEYFIRIIDPGAEPPYSSYRSISLGTVVVRGVVVDSSKNYFTPVTYSVEVEEVLCGTSNAVDATSLYSLRGRFCEILLDGERFEAGGKLEKLIYEDGSEVFRIYLGYKGDYVRIL